MPERRIRTYIKGFDEELGGGIPEGQVILLSGSSGTMKSSLAYYILYHNALKGIRGLYITLEQGASSVMDQMVSMGLNPGFVSEDLPILDLSNGREHFEELASKLSQLKHGKALKETAFMPIFKSKIVQLKRKSDFHLLTLDSWDAFELLVEFKDKRSNTFDFFEWLKKLGATSFLILEANPSFLLQGDDLEEEFLADGIIELKLENINDVDVQRRIRCVKMRSTNHSTDYFTLLFENSRFEVVKAIS